MIDMKSSITRRDAYRTRRDIVAALLIALLIWGAASVSELVAENRRLQDELIQVLAVSSDAADYMTREGHGSVFTGQDLD